MTWDVFADIPVVNSPIRMETVRVPAGEFLMGSALANDREASKGELPQSGSLRSPADHPPGAATHRKPMP